jgi:hypothetical protein
MIIATIFTSCIKFAFGEITSMNGLLRNHYDSKYSDNVTSPRDEGLTAYGGTLVDLHAKDHRHHFMYRTPTG